MKKILLLICLLSIPFLVIAEDTCNQNDIKIESIVLDSTNGNIEETSNPNADNNQVNLGLKMNVIDDSITYKLVITNTSNQDYTFDKNSLSTDYVNYDITYEDNTNLVKAGESKVIFLTVNYSSKPSIDKLSNGVLVDNPKVTFNLQKEEAQTVIEEVVRKIVNPETNDVIGIFLLILIISLIITIILFRRSKRVKYITLLILTILLTSNIVKALCTCTLDINTSLEIDAREAVFLPGTEVNVKMKELAGDDTTQRKFVTKDYNIISIKKSSTEVSETNKEEKNIVSTSESSYPIYMWFDEGTIYWWSEDKTPSLNKDAKNSFTNLNELKDITGIKHFDTSVTENMADLLSFAYSLVSVDELTHWNTSNVTSLRRLFIHNHDLASVEGVKNWDVRKVVDMGQVFNSCYSLEEVDLSNWETNSVENLQTTFGMWELNGNPYYNSKLKRIIISNKFNTSKVIQMYGLFANNLNIEDYSFLKLIDTSKTTNIGQMFQLTNFKDLKYIKDWDVSKVETMNGLFNSNEYVESLSGLENWDVSSVTNYNQLFYKASSLVDASAINDWNINSNASFTNMFYDVQTHPEFSKVLGTWNNKGTFIPGT